MPERVRLQRPPFVVVTARTDPGVRVPVVTVPFVLP